MERLKLILAVVGIIREVLGNKELLNAIRKLVDELEVIADAIPGDVPDKWIDRIQEVIGDPTPDVDLVGK